MVEWEDVGVVVPVVAGFMYRVGKDGRVYRKVESRGRKKGFKLNQTGDGVEKVSGVSL